MEDSISFEPGLPEQEQVKLRLAPAIPARSRRSTSGSKPHDRTCNCWIIRYLQLPEWNRTGRLRLPLAQCVDGTTDRAAHAEGS